MGIVEGQWRGEQLNGLTKLGICEKAYGNPLTGKIILTTLIKEEFEWNCAAWVYHVALRRHDSENEYYSTKHVRPP